METSELSRHAEESQKRMENLISQLKEASKEQISVIDLYRKENSVLRKTIEKTDIKLKTETGVANFDTKKKLSEAESEISCAKKTIDKLKQENEQLESKLMENKRMFQHTNQTLETLKEENQIMKSRCKEFDDNVGKLELKWQGQIKENDILRCTNKQQNEHIQRLQQENDRLKHELNDFAARNHNTVHVQMYAAVNKELCGKMMDELEEMLSLQFELNNSTIQVDKCHKPPPQSEVPLIVICINASRLGTDVNQALQNISRSQTVAVVILHHKEVHALPRQPSEKLLIGSEYKDIGAIVDIAYLTTKGIYPCDMNEKSLVRLVDFIKSNSS